MHTACSSGMQLLRRREGQSEVDIVIPILRVCIDIPVYTMLEIPILHLLGLTHLPIPLDPAM